MTDGDFTQKAGEFLPSGNEEGADDGKKSGISEMSAIFSGELRRSRSVPPAWRSGWTNSMAKVQLGGNRLFYLATPPEVYLHVIEQLKKAGLNKPKNGKILDADHHRKTVWARSGVGKRIKQQGSGSVRRIAGVPH